MNVNANILGITLYLHHSPFLFVSLLLRCESVSELVRSKRRWMISFFGVCAPDILFIHIFRMNAQNCDHLAFIAKSGGCNRHSEDVAYSLCFFSFACSSWTCSRFARSFGISSGNVCCCLNWLYLQLDCSVVLLLLCALSCSALSLLLLLCCYPSHDNVYWIVILERIWFTWCINFVSKMEKHLLWLCVRGEREREEERETECHQSGWIHKTPKIVHGLSSKHYSF